jgi:hypothetical protein
LPTQTQKIRVKFFDYLFQEQEGYVCLAVAEPKRARQTWRQSFFKWPDERQGLIDFVEKIGHKKNVWFCVNLLDKTERRKEHALPGNIVWADLDTAKPSEIEPEPNVIIESSPGRYQAIWRLDKTVPPEQAEEYSKRIAYEYKQEGSDPSGWDITQMLRVPYTLNFKYDNAPEVKLVQATEDTHETTVFEQFDLAPGDLPQVAVEDMPAIDSLPNPDQVIYKHQLALKDTAFQGLYSVEPNRSDDWSGMLWRLINICIESGMTVEETFAVSNAAACNKYRRDARPPEYLWRDVTKAEARQRKLTAITATFVPVQMPQIVASNETSHTFIDEYREWASEATDALVHYHDLSAFILLSSFMAGGLTVKTSYGPMVPNIWGLVLGDSTLTRKTTAMRMAIDMINEIDQEIILATDGSVEGLLQGLSTRPGRVSMFWKDEVSGFIDSINRKDYLAGMPETLTQLYDVPPVLSRRLRKETIYVTNPIFIFFGGGIRDKVYSLLNEEYILSGFLPRFLIVSGDADLNRIRRTGPATPDESGKRDKLRMRLSDMYENYNRTAQIKLGAQIDPVEVVQKVEGILTPEAWQRYGDIEMEMVQKAAESPVSMLALPTFERLSRSCLKLSCLLAAARQNPSDELKIEISEQDVVNASGYIQDWGRYSAELITNAGKGSTQRVLDRILRAIKQNPGITRSYIMQRHHLTKREMDEILSTLEDRGEIRIKKEGRGSLLWAI